MSVVAWRSVANSMADFRGKASEHDKEGATLMLLLDLFAVLSLSFGAAYLTQKCDLDKNEIYNSVIIAV